MAVKRYENSLYDLFKRSRVVIDEDLHSDMLVYLCRILILHTSLTQPRSKSHMSSTVLSYPLLSCPLLSSPILSSPLLSCPVLSYPVLSYSVLSYPVLSCPILSCSLLSCPVVLSCAFSFLPLFPSGSSFFFAEHLLFLPTTILLDDIQAA